MLLINHGTVMDMEGHCWQDGYVLCEGSRIVETGQNFDQSLYRGRVSGDEVLNVHGLQVLPGMLEAHCHVGITEEKKGIEGDDCNEGTTPVTPQLRALDAINPMDVAFQNAMKAGITGLMIGPGSSNVVGGQFVFLKTYGRCVDDMKVMEPAAMKVAFGENPKKKLWDERKPSVHPYGDCSHAPGRAYERTDLCRQAKAAGSGAGFLHGAVDSRFGEKNPSESARPQDR